LKGNNLGKNTLNNYKTIVCLLIILAALTTVLFVPHVKAETKIISLSPSSGTVGAVVSLRGNISTLNGRYLIKFDEEEIYSENATEYTVNATFRIPNTFKGSHNITLIDYTTKENATTIFTVETTYLLNVLPEIIPPAQRQEGDSVQILLNISGGEKSKLFRARIAVQSPSNDTFTQLVNVTTSRYGNATEIVSFPEDFENATTEYVGEYRIFFNTTLAQETFFIGLTNSTEYHRYQIVDIKASGYLPSENVTLTITGQDLHHSTNLTADSEGLIHYTNFSMPFNASIGTYKINITSISGNTTKTPPDAQTFTVPGFKINVTTRNLAGEPVPNVTVNAFENTTLAANKTSNHQGIVVLKLEIGNYTLEAYYKTWKVGLIAIEVTNDTSLSFPCNLTNLKIRVTGTAKGKKVPIPNVKLFLRPDNLIKKTNATGTVIFHSLRPNVSYTINASRYEIHFNTTTISTLFIDGGSVAWYNVTIGYPSFTLRMDVVNPNAETSQPIVNATVKIREISGLYYEGKTSESGEVIFDLLLGKYKVEVYEENGIMLNETTFEFFEDKNLTIYCNLYGLVINVKVVDYLGQPIQNVEVKLQRANLIFLPQTYSGGTAIFSNIVGGDLQAYIYIVDQKEPCVVKPFSAEKSTTVVINIEKYIVLAGFLIETSQFVTILIIAMTLILLVLVEIYRRRYLKGEESES